MSGDCKGVPTREAGLADNGRMQVGALGTSSGGVECGRSRPAETSAVRRWGMTPLLRRPRYRGDGVVLFATVAPPMQLSTPPEDPSA